MIAVNAGACRGALKGSAEQPSVSEPLPAGF